MKKPMFKWKYEFSPSSELSDVNIGEVFLLGRGGKTKRFMMLDRDPWKAYIIRYTALDALCERIGLWFRSKRKSG